MTRSPDARDERDLEAMARRIGALERTVDRLIDILVGREQLNEGHRRLLARAASGPGRPGPKTVKLKPYSGDKYEVAGPDVDCAGLMHLCRARCCTLEIALTRQDIEEGELDWKLEEPYLLLKASDGYCTYVADGGGCSVYDRRPMTCRTYDCRDDKRIWLDFENKIPAPLGVARDFES